MGFQVTFYTLKKSDNSTKRPADSGTSFTCTIRRGSGILEPHIELDIGLSQAPLWNYCYIPDFERYYRVLEWYNDGPLWIAKGVVDVLASYKEDIAATPLYALRASGSYDGRIPDMYYPAKSGCTFSKSTITVPWESTSAGYFVVGIVGKDPDFGAVNYYQMNQEAFNALITALNDDTIIMNGFDPSDASLALQKSIVNPLQYIKSCNFLPVQYQVGTPTLALDVWNWTIPMTGAGISCKKIRKGDPDQTLADINISIPKHPQAATRGTFLNSAPYSIYTLAFPPFGVIDIDTSAINNVDTLTLRVSIDWPTGLGILSVYAGSTLLNRIEAQVGVEVVLSQVTRDYMGAAGAIMSGIGSIASAAVSLAFPPAGLAGGALTAFKGASVMQGVGGSGSAIGNAITALTPRSQTIGSGGSYGQLYQEAGLYAQFFEIVDDDINKNGRPLCKVVYPEEGYYKIQDGDVPIEGTAIEAAQIKAYLETGFYME